jgi:hypothetical protein
MDGNRTELDYLRMAFWAEASGEVDSMPHDMLQQMADDLDALARDAASYWLEHLKAPLLAERGESQP